MVNDSSSQPISYQYDIFISYRRNIETHRWITEHFQPLLALRVEFELGRKPLIYLDDQIESGTSWPASLGAALGASRTLIALWSGNYLASEWCAEELSHMLGREREENLRTVNRPHGVIIPVFIHDGDKFPAILGHIKYFEVQKYFNVRMAANSPRAEELDNTLALEAPAIAACIDKAPPRKATWSQEAAAHFFNIFHQRAEAVQGTVPRFTAA